MYVALLHSLSPTYTITHLQHTFVPSDWLFFYRFHSFLYTAWQLLRLVGRLALLPNYKRDNHFYAQYLEHISIMQHSI